MQKVSHLRRLLRLFLKGIPDNVFYIVGIEVEAKANKYKRSLFKHAGENLQLASNAFIMVPGQVTFGDNCCINEFVHILGGGGLHCGNGVWIANHASVVTSTHPTDVEFIGDHPQIDLPVSIEDNVWIGSHAVILPGVHLGRSCIVGAGAVVTKNVPAYAVVGGVPAHVIRYKGNSIRSGTEA